MSNKQLLKEQLYDEITSSWKTQVLYVAAELRIPDLLFYGPKSVKELSDITQSNETSLYRLLRALTTIEICKEEPGGTFSICPMGELLQTNHPESIRSWTLWWGSQLWQDWGNLLYSIKTGKSARKLSSGIEGFSHFEQNPEASAVFNNAMVELSRWVSDSIIDAYDFSKFKKVVDIGGGYGELLTAVLEKYPFIKGVLFDLPHVMEGAKLHLKKRQFDSRCEFIEGDFFLEIPKGADAYLMKSVIHDWNDKNSIRILTNCRKALGKTGRLLLIERLVPQHLESNKHGRNIARVDITMLVAHAAQERTEEQIHDLLYSAGLQCNQFIPAGSFYIIEAITRTN